jgi:outer membrane protein OmpA-like peptidoglycan-associated protein
MKGLWISGKMKTLLSVFATILVLYAVSGFWALPMLLSEKIPQLTQQHLKRTSSVQKISFNPFTLELAFDGLALKNHQNENDFIRFERLYINASLLRSISQLSLTLQEIRLQQPFVLIKRNQQGKFNFDDLLSNDNPEADDEENQQIFPFTLEKIALTEGTVRWADNFHKEIQQEDIHPLNLSLTGLTTRTDKQSEIGITLEFASGGELSWQGQLSLNPLFSEGHVELNKIDFARVWELFLKNKVPFEILNGSEQLSIDYQLTDSVNGVRFALNNGQLAISTLQITEPGSNKPVIDIPAFNLKNIAVDLHRKSVNISELNAQDALFTTWLNPDGSFNYVKLFSPADNADTNAVDSSETKNDPWKINLKQLAFNNFALQFADKTLPTPAHIDISAFNLAMQDISNRKDAILPFTVNLTLNQNGSLTATGNTQLSPFSGNIKLNAEQIALKTFQPYLDKAAQLDIVSGLFAIDASIALQSPIDSGITIKLEGNSQISNFVSRDRVSKQDFVKWKQLDFNKMDMDSAANHYQIDTIKIEQPYTKVLIREDKSINLTDILLPPKDSTAKTNTTAPAPTFKIGRFELVEGESDFSDLSLILPFAAHINQMAGDVTGISSDKKAVAKISLTGKVDDLSPVEIKGKINPSRGDSEVALKFQSMPMPLMTPYMAEFAGRKIEKGNMSLDLQYKIQDGKLTADNSLLIEHLTLGEKVDNPEAVSLPLELALALLEDSNGKIALDVPVSGSLEDPDFSIGGIIIDALTNVLGKLITSPFNAIASLINSNEDISKILFSGGSSELNEQQIDKLNQLATALINRPGVKLEIKGTASRIIDWPKMREQALRQYLIQSTIKATSAEDPNKTQELPSLSDKDYKSMLAERFIQQHPEMAERSFFGTPRLISPGSEDFYAVATATLSAAIPPDPERLQKLAVARAKAVAKHLVTSGLPVKRIFLLDTSVKDTHNQAEVILNLSAL